MNSADQKNKHHDEQANKRSKDDSSEETPVTDTGSKYQDPTTTKKWKQELFVLKFCIYLLVAAVVALTIITNLSDNNVLTRKLLDIIVLISALFPVAFGVYFAFVTVSKNDLKAITLYDKLIVRLLIFASIWVISAPAIEVARDSPTSLPIILTFLAVLFLPFYIAYLVIFRRNKHTEAAKDKKVVAPGKLKIALAIVLLLAACWWGYGVVALVSILTFLSVWGSGEAWLIISAFLVVLYIAHLVISKRNKHTEPTSAKQVVASDKLKMITLTILGFLIGAIWGALIALMLALSSGEG